MSASYIPPGCVRAYVSGGHCAHLVQDGAGLGGSAPHGRSDWYGSREWLGLEPGRYRAQAMPLCWRCVRQAEVLRQLNGQVPAPGVVLTVVLGKKRYRVAECAGCERLRPLPSRGLCRACHSRHWLAGTLEEFGYTRAERLEEFRELRARNLTVAQAARRLGVNVRTAQRYERDTQPGQAVA